MTAFISHTRGVGLLPLSSGPVPRVSGARSRAAVVSNASRRHGGAMRLSIRATADSEVQGSSAGLVKAEYKRPVRSKEKKDIYLGKGRTIKDDPKKYPDRNELGVGGWAGGEIGLWEFKEEVKSSPQVKSKDASGLDISKIAGFLGSKDPNDSKTFKARVNGMQVDAEVRGGGEDIIYIGKDKGQKQAPGTPGKFVKDNEQKYPDKEDVGILYGATGGFAGGEQGVKQFVETGDIDLLPPGARRSSPPSPLLVLFAIGGAAGLSAVFLGSGSVTSDQGGLVTASGGISNPLAAASAMDSNTLLLLQLGLIGLGSVGAVIGGRAAIIGARRKLMESTKDTLVYALYFGGIILALKAVLEN